MQSTVLRYMYQANASACPALISSAIYFEHGVLKLPSDTLLCRMEPLFDTATWWSLSARPKSVPESGLAEQYTEIIVITPSTTQSARE